MNVPIWPGRTARFARCFLTLALALAVVLVRAAPVVDAPLARWRIMPVGDSITEGGATFSNYRPLLAEKLRAAGIAFEFVGSRGPDGLRHEGYGGKNIEFLAAAVPTNFARTPADIVLLHAGHNHFDTEQPVPGMIAATDQLIAAFRATNPKVIVLLAQAIPAGKLPKYSYLPDFNAALARLAARLHTPAQPIILVDQATGFDWRTDTIADLVHPNAAGAQKMSDRWFAALSPLLTKPRAPRQSRPARAPRLRKFRLCAAQPRPRGAWRRRGIHRAAPACPLSVCLRLPRHCRIMRGVQLVE